eukprot:229061-Pelagomonas_calceolata.AAC.1
MVPVGVHPIHCLVNTSKGNVINAVHFVAQWAACRGGREFESDGMFLGVNCSFALREWVMSFWTDSAYLKTHWNSLAGRAVKPPG